MTVDENDIPTAFLCYARHDDVTDDGRITELRARIEREVQATTGEPFAILQDTSDILVGTQFRDEIDAMLDQASALISFVTPSLLKSPNCRAEIMRFRQRSESEPSHPPVFPILYRPTRGLENGSDEVAVYLKHIQYADWRPYRFHDLTSAEMRQEVSLLATDISSLLQSRVSDQTNLIEVALPQEVDSPGFVDLMVELEEALPKLPQGMNDFTAVLKECTAITTEMAESAQAAANGPKPAAAKLRVIHQLRQRLEEPALRMETLAKGHELTVASVGRGMDALIGGVGRSNNENEIQSARDLLVSLSSMVEAAEIAHNSVSGLRKAVANIGQLSSTLRPVYGRIDRALGIMFPGLDEYRRWRDGLASALHNIDMSSRQ